METIVIIKKSLDIFLIRLMILLEIWVHYHMGRDEIDNIIYENNITSLGDNPFLSSLDLVFYFVQEA